MSYPLKSEWVGRFRWLLVLIAVCISPLAEADRVWAEGNLATVLVGTDPTSKLPVREKLMLIALGPDEVDPIAQHDRYANCMLTSVVKVVEAEATWKTLDLDVKPWFKLAEDIRQAGQPVNATTLSAARAARVREVARVFADARRRFLMSMTACGLPASVAGTARLAVVNRVCMENGLRPCTGNDFLANPEYSSASRYSKVFEWFQSAGVRAENDFLEIGPEAQLTPIVVVHELYKDKPWPQPRSAEQAQRAFELGAVQMRKSRAKYDYVVPRAIGLSKETGLRLVDVISAPSLSIPALANAQPGRAELLTLSDEIARSRITECVTLRAVRDPAEVSKCAGYALDMPTLGKCMNGGACVPALSMEGYAALLEHASVRSGQQLLETSLPRLRNEQMQLWSQYQSVASECKKKPRGEAALCMSRAGLRPSDQKTLDCASAVASKSGGTAGVSKCLVDSLPDGPNKDVLKCASSDPKSARLLALCATLPTAPKEVRAGVSCIERFMKESKKDAAFQCLNEPGFTSTDAAKAAACINKYPKDYAAAAVCFEAGNKLPEGSDEAVACANSADDYKKFAGCMVTTKLFGNTLSGDGGRLVNCAAQSGGDGIGTLACMAGSSLTPEQQIALQCAAQSPDLITFAGCTGGQLSLREFIKCQGREFGDEVCFGPNNEIRKFLKVVGIDVSKDTVGGKIANAQLNVLKAQVAFAEAAGKEVVKVGEALFQAADAIGQAAGNAVNGLVNAGQAVLTGVGKALGF